MAVIFGLVCALSAGIIALRIWPKYTSMTERYSLAEFPAGGHRYIINDGGIKVVGQQVVTYRIRPDALTGTVRRDVGQAEVQSFRLDLTSGRVEYSPTATSVEPEQP